MAKEDKIEVEGRVIEILKGGKCLVELDNGHKVIGYVGGKMKVNMIRIIEGDKVTLEMSPYDLTMGRITYRNK